MPVDRIIDIYWDNDVDLHDARDAGVLAVIHKATEGTSVPNNLHDAAVYPQRKQRAQQLGLLWGAYHLTNGDPAEDQLAHFLSVEDGSDPSILLALDWERSHDGTIMNIVHVREFVRLFNQRFPGRYPMIYGGWTVRENHDILQGDTLLAKCPLWYQQYSPHNGPLPTNAQPLHLPKATWPTATLWQYSDEHTTQYGAPTIPALGGSDWNRFAGTADELAAQWPFSRSTSAPDASPLAIASVAATTRAGTGNRKKPVASSRRPKAKKAPPSVREGSRRLFGWVPDLPDHRDFRYAAPAKVVKALPKSVDLRPGCPPIYSQGDIGSCTANAIAAAIEFDLRKQNKPVFQPSRLFIYYNERVIEHSVTSDADAQNRNGIKSVAKQGVCPESLWTYDDTPADPDTWLWPATAKPRKKPPVAAYKEALNHQALSYQRLDRSLAQLRGCLASGYPFIFGFTVYEGFRGSAVEATGVVNLPSADESVVGGHAVLAVGYDDATERFLVRNSWGDRWGIEGHFTMPYAYLMDDNLSDDFWTIRVVE